MLFKVGETVTVREDLSTTKTYFSYDKTASDIVTLAMASCRGMTAKITECRSSGKYKIDINSDFWTDEMFEECYDLNSIKLASIDTSAIKELL